MSAAIPVSPSGGGDRCPLDASIKPSTTPPTITTAAVTAAISRVAGRRAGPPSLRKTDGNGSSAGVTGNTSVCPWTGASAAGRAGPPTAGRTVVAGASGTPTAETPTAETPAS